MRCPRPLYLGVELALTSHSDHPSWIKNWTQNKLPVTRWISSGDLIYSKAAIVDNAEFEYLYLNVAESRSETFWPQKRNCNCVTWWRCKCYSRHHVKQVHKLNTSYILNLYSIVCQLYLNKLGTEYNKGFIPQLQSM